MEAPVFIFNGQTEESKTILIPFGENSKPEPLVRPRGENSDGYFCFSLIITQQKGKNEVNPYLSKVSSAQNSY